MTQRLWTPTFIGTALVGLCGGLIFYILVPPMAGYAQQRFGVGPTAAGALASIFFIGALVGRLFSGRLVEIFGARQLARWATVGFVITTAAYLIVPTYTSTMVVRLLNGTSFGLLSSALTSGIMLTVPPSRRSEGAGWYGVSLSLAIGLGPFLSLQLNHRWGMTAVFWVATGIIVVGLLLVLTLGRGLPGPITASEMPRGLGVRSLLDRRAFGIGLMMFFGGFAYSAVLAYLDVATVGTPLAAAAAWFFLVYAAVVMVTRPAGGRLQDRRGERFVLVPSWVLYVLAMVTIALAWHGSVLLIAAAMLGAAFGTLMTGSQAAAVNRVPRERFGAAIATYFFLLDLGTGIGPIVLGVLVEPFGYRGVFWAAAGACVAGLITYLIVIVRKPVPNPPGSASVTDG